MKQTFHEESILSFEDFELLKFILQKEKLSLFIDDSFETSDETIKNTVKSLVNLTLSNYFIYQTKKEIIIYDTSENKFEKIRQNLIN